MKPTATLTLFSLLLVLPIGVQAIDGSGAFNGQVKVPVWAAPGTTFVGLVRGHL